MRREQLTTALRVRGISQSSPTTVKEMRQLPFAPYIRREVVTRVNRESHGKFGAICALTRSVADGSFSVGQQGVFANFSDASEEDSAVEPCDAAALEGRIDGILSTLVAGTAPGATAAAQPMEP
mmetsp:Transcript_22511/g.70494  ORF Transcript_22511/g.70494 Transcript_22511/m.70494 type:complete len:124 (-) Transcript_22511:54-425(-)